MGGSSYDRTVYSSKSTTNWGSSGVSASKLSADSLDPSMNPAGKILKSDSKTPIIIVLDVTGSNINFARLVYDKLPMFYGQIEQKGYFDDFELSICAVGDAWCDSYPLQIGDFAKGIELDSWMEKLVLEGGGGGQSMESYELAAYYLAKKTQFRKDANPIVFFIADEMPYSEVDKDQAEELGIEYRENTDGFSNLRTVFNDNVFTFLNKYCGIYEDMNIREAWKNVLPAEHLINIKEEKAIVDLMLGVLALLAKRNLNAYAIEMKNRGQTIERINNVTASLGALSNALIPIESINTNLPIDSKGMQRVISRGKRLN